MSLTSLQQVVVMEFGKRPDTTQQTQRAFARANLVRTRKTFECLQITYIARN